MHIFMMILPIGVNDRSFVPIALKDVFIRDIHANVVLVGEGDVEMFELIICGDLRQSFVAIGVDVRVLVVVWWGESTWDGSLSLL